MVEFKFRAWDKINKEIFEIDGDFLYLADGKVYEVEEVSHSYQTYMSKKDVSERYTPMQYTGLKDKNGKEIYEGDILKATYFDFEYILKVIFDADDLCFSVLEDDGISCPLVNYKKHYKLEVIGNIYENPNLIRKEMNQ